MSQKSERVSEALYSYIAAHTAGEDAFLATLKSAAAEASIPSIWISPEQASFMQILLRLIEAKQVVEVGTLAGYSAINMARALRPEGRVRTIEVDPRHAAFAERWIADSDVAGQVEVLLGDARDVLAEIADQSADAFFIDADKVGYREYLGQGLRILRLGGLMMVDNAFAFGQVLDEESREDSVIAIRKFNEEMAAIEELQSIIVPLGDGCWVGVKQEPAPS